MTMAKFRDASGAGEAEARTPAPQSSAAAAGQTVSDRSIGDIIRDTRDLSADQVQAILEYQKTKQVRFGEAAVALGFATTDDVLFALSQQFHYPYAPQERRATNPELVTLNSPFSVQAEAFRAVRSQIMMRLYGEGQPKAAIAVISPESGDGKTYFSANLAVALAQLGGRTLLVDADLRGPRQHEVFALPNAAGLSNILSGRAESQVIQQVTGLPTLFVLPAGPTPPNPLELVERPAFGLLMKELSAKFDHVVVDTAAAMYGTDGCVISTRCGAALVVARKGASKVERLEELVASLDGSPARLAGVIVNEY